MFQKMNFWTLLISLLILSNTVLAQDAVYLNQNDKAPFTGYLLPQEKLVELKNNTMERDTLEAQNASLNASLKLQDDIIAKKDQQLILYSNQNDKLAQTANSALSLSTWEKVGYITLGIVVTGLAIKGAHELYR